MRGLAGRTLVKRHGVGVAHPGAAKDVQRRSDRQIDATASQPCDVLQVCQGVCAAGVGCGNSSPCGEFFDQFTIDTAAEAFDIDGVDEELGAGLCEALERVALEHQL